MIYTVYTKQEGDQYLFKSLPASTKSLHNKPNVDPVVTDKKLYSHTGDLEGPYRTVRVAGERDSVRRIFLEKLVEGSHCHSRQILKVKKPQNPNI